jgi:hypothetical protein
MVPVISFFLLLPLVRHAQEKMRHSPSELVELAEIRPGTLPLVSTELDRSSEKHGWRRFDMSDGTSSDSAGEKSTAPVKKAAMDPTGGATESIAGRLSVQLGLGEGVAKDAANEISEVPPFIPNAINAGFTSQAKKVEKAFQSKFEKVFEEAGLDPMEP